MKDESALKTAVGEEARPGEPAVARSGRVGALEGDAGRRRAAWRWVAVVGDQVGLVVVLVGMVLAFGWTTPYFLTVDRFVTIANQNSAAVLVAVGMTYVLIIAGIDLSVGSVLGLAGVVVGALMTGGHDWPLWAAVIAALGAGVAVGLFNGVVSEAWGIPSFVVTLGTLEVARGLAHLVSGSRTAYIGGRAGGIADATMLGLSATFWVAIGAVVVGQFVLSRTVFGRYMVAVGTNEEAVRLSGVATRPVKVAVYVIAGLLAAAGGVMDVSRAQASNPNAGSGLELTAIAAVVIGGTSLMGGRGSVVNSLLGVAVIAVLGAGLAARGAGDETKRMITGFVIILAVIIDYYRRRLARRLG